MRNPFIDFTIKAAILLGIVFFIHLGVLKALSLPAFDNRIVLCYLINFALIIIVFGALYLFKEKYKSQLGFLFLAGSFLKFIIFFIVFYPFFKMDNHISKLEFATFFVPYSIGLILETISLSKWLNKLE
jgi:hypothetical protein